MTQNRYKIVAFYKEAKVKFRTLLDSYEDEADAGDAFTKIIKIFEELTKKYCDIHGYDFEFKIIDDEDLKPIAENKKKYEFLRTFDKKYEEFENIILYKMILVRDALMKDDSEYVVFLDSDAIIAKPDIKLDKFIDNGHEFWMSPGSHEVHVRNAIDELTISTGCLFQNKELFSLFLYNPHDGCEKIKAELGVDINELFKKVNMLIGGFNEGFFIVKNTQNMKNLFTLICDNLYLSYNSPSYKGIKYGADGYLIQYFINSPKFFKSFTYMTGFSQGHVLGAFDGLYNDESFIQHNYMLSSIHNKLKLAQKVKHNQWWRKIYEEPKKPSRILLQSNDCALGDLVTISPFFKDFKTQHPDIDLFFDLNVEGYAGTPDFMKRPKELFHEHANSVKIWNGEDIDKVVEFMNYPYLRSSRFLKEINMIDCIYDDFEAKTGIHVDRSMNRADITLSDEEKSDAVLKKFGISTDKPICLCMFGYQTKLNSIKYPGSVKIQNIINALKDEIQFVNVSNKDLNYHIFDNAINLIGKTNLSELLSLMYHSRFVLVQITSAIHIATIETKYDRRDVFCFIGCRETPTWFAPYEKIPNVKYHWLGYHPENFKNCLDGMLCCVSDIVHRYDDTPKWCKLCKNVVMARNEQIPKCLNDITVDEVVEEFKKVIK